MKVITHTVKTPRVTLYPLSDVHWPNNEPDKLETWRECVLADPTALVTLGGDLFDFARGKYRMHLRSYVSDANSRLPIDDMAYGWVDGFVEFLRPVRDKILMTTVGNHFWIFANGRVSDQELAIQLGRKDSWVGAYGIARVKFMDGKRTRGQATIALHHDAGRKGGTVSSDLLAFQHWSHQAEADVYLAGHTHRQYVGVFHTRLRPQVDRDLVGARNLVFARSGAFMKSYPDNIVLPDEPFIPDYAELGVLPPTVLGLISIGIEVGPTGKLVYELRQRTL